MYINLTYVLIAAVAILAILFAIKYGNKLKSLIPSGRFQWPEMSHLTVWLVVLTAFIYITQFVWVNDDGSPIIASVSPARLSLLIFANFSFVLFIIVAKMALKHMDRTLFDYFTNDWKFDFETLTTWQKFKIILFSFFAFMLSLIAVFAIVG
jgi:hypothetical protein